MVTPMQNLAGTLFTNTINLVGGVTLCFLTSWRLSLLAFTTVGPIMVRARAVTAPTRDAVRAPDRRAAAALLGAQGHGRADPAVRVLRADR